MRKLLAVILLLCAGQAEALKLVAKPTLTAAQATMTPAYPGVISIDYATIIPTPPPTPQPTVTPIPTGYYEPYLGLPDADGKVLSSTVAGVRSWITAGGGGGPVTWGFLTGTLSNQTDLNTALGNRELTANKGAASGYCPLNSSTKIDTTYLAMGGNSQPASLNTSSKLVIGEIPTGSTVNDVCVGNDARLSDARVPTTHDNTKHSASYIVVADVTDANMTTTDVATNNASTSKHGFASKLPASGGSTLFMRGDNTYTTIPETALSTSDNTTNDTSTSKHGYAPKLPGGTTNYFRADGTWNSPPGGGSSAPVTSIVSNVVIANVTTETKVLSLLIPSGTLAVGTCYQLLASAVGGVTATAPNITFRMRMGAADDLAGAIVSSVVITPSVSVTGRDFFYTGLYTQRTTGNGTGMGSAMVINNSSTAATFCTKGSNQTATAAVTTTVNNYMVFSIQFSAASAANTITVYDAAIYCVKP